MDTDWHVHELERTRRFVDYHVADPLAPILLNRAALDPQLAELEATYLQRISYNAAKNIRRGQKLGQLPADIEPDSAGAFIIGGIRYGIAQQLRLTPLPAPGQITDRLWRLISAALGAD